ncbi:MAG: TOBE domain-containing protein [Methylobacillus sp.]|jgi:molybdate transport system regulatory protein|nr:TOBE domain-containing protein [Methylobacillus sp.]
MNQLQGIIVAIQSNGHLSLVDVRIGDDTFTSILLETPESTPWLKPGNPVELMFKATEVALGKNLSGLLSLRNRIPATVRDIRHGAILSEVALDYRGQIFYSIVTTRAVERLELVVGDAVEALVKSNEMSLREIPQEPLSPSWERLRPELVEGGRGEGAEKHEL